MNSLRFNNIKRLLAQPGATISSVARKATASWETVKRVAEAESFSAYQNGLMSQAAVDSSANNQEIGIIAQLEQERAAINEQFDTIIATLRKLKK